MMTTELSEDEVVFLKRLLSIYIRNEDPDHLDECSYTLYSKLRMSNRKNPISSTHSDDMSTASTQECEHEYSPEDMLGIPFHCLKCGVNFE